MKLPHIFALALLTASSAIAVDRPTPQSLADAYIAAVKNRDAQALRALIAPAAYEHRTDKERDYIETTWVQSAFRQPQAATAPTAVRVRPWEASQIRVHPDRKWPLQPTSVITITHETTAGHAETVLAAVAVDNQFFIIGPLPPKPQ